MEASWGGVIYLGLEGALSRVGKGMQRLGLASLETPPPPWVGSFPFLLPGPQAPLMHAPRRGWLWIHGLEGRLSGATAQFREVGAGGGREGVRAHRPPPALWAVCTTLSRTPRPRRNQSRQPSPRPVEPALGLRLL